MYTFTRKSGCIAVDCFLEWFYVYFHTYIRLYSSRLFFGVVLCILSLVNQVA